MEGVEAAMTNKKFRTRSMEKQRGMAFGFRKTATAVKIPDRYTLFPKLYIGQVVLLFVLYVAVLYRSVFVSDVWEQTGTD